MYDDCGPVIFCEFKRFAYRAMEKILFGATCSTHMLIIVAEFVYSHREMGLSVAHFSKLGFSIWTFFVFYYILHHCLNDSRYNFSSKSRYEKKTSSHSFP